MPDHRINISDIQYGILIKHLDTFSPMSADDEIPVSHLSTGKGDTDKTYRASLGSVVNNIKFGLDNNGNLKAIFGGNSSIKPLSNITIENLDSSFILPENKGGTGSSVRNFLKNTTDILEGQLTVKEKDNFEAYIASVGTTSAAIGAHTTVEENNSVKVNGVTLRTQGNYISLFDSTNSEDIIKKDVLEAGSATTFYGTATSAISASTAQKAEQLTSILPISKGGTNASTPAAARIQLSAAEMGVGTSAGIFNNLQHADQLFYIQGAASSNATLKDHKTWLVVRDDGLNVWDANTAKMPWNLTFPIPITMGGTGASTVTAAQSALGIYSSTQKRPKNTVLAGPISGNDAVAAFRTLNEADIPNLNANKITSGVFADARIPNLNASKITAGTLPVARGGTGQTTPFTSYYIANGSGIGSGSTTFSVAGAKLINILARFGDASTGGLVSLTIPNFINSSGSYYQLADDSSFIKFRLRSTSTNKVTMDTFSRTSSTCVITHINLIY